MFGRCFSQTGSPTLLLASKHATYSKRFRLTWISSCVRRRRSGQPRNGLEDCRWSDMCCLRGNKNWEVGFSVVHASIFSRCLLRWSEVFHHGSATGVWPTPVVSTWRCHTLCWHESNCLRGEEFCPFFFSTFWEWTKHNFLISFWARKDGKILIFQSFMSHGCWIISCVSLIHFHLQLWIHEVNFHTFETWICWNPERCRRCYQPLKRVWHWRGFSSWCRFGLKCKMLRMVGLTGRFLTNLVFFLETQWMLCMKISK